MEELRAIFEATRRAKARESAARLDPASKHYLRDVKRRHVDAETFEECRVRRWRMKNGLEHRALMALLHAPELLAEARQQLSPADFLTPAYAALAAIVLDAEPGAGVVQQARAAIVGRAYLPSPSAFDWTAEGRELVARLAERRERWTREMLAGRRKPTH